MSDCSNISISVRLNGELSRQVGQARLVIMLPEGSTVDALYAKVGEDHPILTDRLNMTIPVVNGRHVAKDQVLIDGQQIALLLPVAGGSICHMQTCQPAAVN